MLFVPWCNEVSQHQLEQRDAGLIVSHAIGEGGRHVRAPFPYRASRLNDAWGRLPILILSAEVRTKFSTGHRIWYG